MDSSSEQEENKIPTIAIIFTIQVQEEIFILYPYLTKQLHPNSGKLIYEVKYKVHDSNNQSLSSDKIPEILRDFTDFSQLSNIVNSNSGELLEVLGVEIKLEEQEINTTGDTLDH